jgi:4-amino-4-deoxy-L-arabinose transferase-like glycosyltransferase
MWLLGAFLTIYAVGAVTFDITRPLWFDEYLTIYYSRLSPHNLWEALAQGADGQPPLSYWITHLSFRIFGESAFATRLPQTVAFLIFLACLYHFVARRTAPLYGGVAMLFPFATLAGQYTSEGRPYAMLLAAFGIGIVCWQAAAEGRARRLSLLGIFLTTTCGVCTHYFAALMLFPIGCAELARWWRLRRVDVAPLLAGILGLWPLAMFRPLIHANQVYQNHFWNKVSPSFLSGVWSDLYENAIPWMLLSAVAIALTLCFRSRGWRSRGESEPSGLAVEEVVLSAALLFLPMAGFALAVLVTGTVHARYVMASIGGAAALIASLAYAYDRGRPMVGTALICSLGLIFGVHEAHHIRRAYQNGGRRPEYFEDYGGNDIAIASPFDFMLLTYPAPGVRAARFTYLADPEASVRQIDSDTCDRLLLVLRHWARLRVSAFRDYTNSHSSFLLLTHVDNGLWIMQELRDQRAVFERLSQRRDYTLFRVTLPPR